MSRENRDWRRTLDACFTKLAHGSAPFITVFLAIHLTAPVMANFGGSSLASRTMAGAFNLPVLSLTNALGQLLGREYYQTSFGEKYLLLAPLVIHPLSAATKRLLSPSDRPPRPLSSVLTVTGYAISLVFLPIHYLTHRVVPRDPNAPIFEVGPAELDFEFVKFGLRNWPLTNWPLYGGLVCCAIGHVLIGSRIISVTWFRDMKLWWQRGRKRTIGLGLALVLPVFSGILITAREPPGIFNSLAMRYEAVFSRIAIFGLS